jgi:hypothetical protein
LAMPFPLIEIPFVVSTVHHQELTLAMRLASDRVELTRVGTLRQAMILYDLKRGQAGRRRRHQSQSRRGGGGSGELCRGVRGGTEPLLLGTAPLRLGRPRVQLPAALPLLAHALQIAGRRSTRQRAPAAGGGRRALRAGLIVLGVPVLLWRARACCSGTGDSGTIEAGGEVT